MSSLVERRTMQCWEMDVCLSPSLPFQTSHKVLQKGQPRSHEPLSSRTSRQRKEGPSRNQARSGGTCSELEWVPIRIYTHVVTAQQTIKQPKWILQTLAEVSGLGPTSFQLHDTQDDVCPADPGPSSFKALPALVPTTPKPRPSLPVSPWQCEPKSVECDVEGLIGDIQTDPQLACESAGPARISAKDWGQRTLLTSAPRSQELKQLSKDFGFSPIHRVTSPLRVQGELQLVSQRLHAARQQLPPVRWASRAGGIRAPGAPAPSAVKQKTAEKKSPTKSEASLQMEMATNFFSLSLSQFCSSLDKFQQPRNGELL